MSYRDLREFIEQVDGLGALRRIDGAHAEYEIGAVTEVAAGAAHQPALLFDNIPGYQPGFRVFSNATMTPQRAALALGVDPSLRPLDALKAWKNRRATLQPVAPRVVQEAPFMANSVQHGGVDLGLFPAPIWHRGDGGPYIGSGSLVVMRDPDSGWINASIYRVQVHGPNRVTIQFDHPGRHGAIIARKYWNAGKPCPVAIVNGEDPALFSAGFEYLPEGVSEFDFAGAIKGAPIDVFAAPQTGLPVPALAEIILEGQLLPMSEISLDEGPFGEFTGYYAADKRPAPLMEVTGVHYRDQPVLLGSPPLKPPRHHFGLPLRGAGIWTNLEAAGVTDIAGVWQHVSTTMTVIALKQRYAGHAKRAALIAAANSYLGRLVVTVDEDIDPSNIGDVLWAITTRCEPSEAADVIRDGWSSSLDPGIHPARRDAGNTTNSKLILNACRPFEWKDRFPTPSALSIEEAAEVERKWGSAIA
ncbi:UbiD family decarboxylase [Paraburkholderia jirisanensis]